MRFRAKLKSKPTLAKTAVIVMASQKGPYDDAKGKAAGVDDHIVKPFDTQFVLDKVKQVLAKPRATISVEAQPAKPAAAAAAVAAVAAAARPISAKTTIAFGAPGATSGAAAVKPRLTGAGPMAPVQPASPALAAAQAAAKKPVTAAVPAPTAAQSPAVAVSTAQTELEAKLQTIGLKPEQVGAVLELSREVVEKVVWEVVPVLAETIIREEIKRLTSE